MIVAALMTVQRWYFWFVLLTHSARQLCCFLHKINVSLSEGLHGLAMLYGGVLCNFVFQHINSRDCLCTWNTENIEFALFSVLWLLHDKEAGFTWVIASLLLFHSWLKFKPDMFKQELKLTRSDTDSLHHRWSGRQEPVTVWVNLKPPGYDQDSNLIPVVFLCYGGG